jgi:tetratricopeptide (TPR) repeat protein
MARAMVACYLGHAYTLSNRAADAIAILKQAVDDAVEMDFMVDHALRLAHLAEAYLLTGQIDDAIDVAHRALASAVKYKERGAQAWTEWLLGEIHSHGTSPEADAHYSKATELASLLGMRPLVAHCHLGLAREYRRTRRNEQAQDHLASAVDLYHTMQMPFWLRMAEAPLVR